MGDLIFSKLAFGIDQVAEKIDKTKWGSNFSWSQVKIFAKYCQIYSVPAGDFIIREGDSAGHLCIVVKGRVVVSKNDDSTRTRTSSNPARDRPSEKCPLSMASPVPHP
jgi:hypothetical protein